MISDWVEFVQFGLVWACSGLSAYMGFGAFWVNHGLRGLNCAVWAWFEACGWLGLSFESAC